MIVNLIKADRMFTLTLPEKIKGQYWITDVDGNGKVRRLIGIEEMGGEWMLKSNSMTGILDQDQNVLKSAVLSPSALFFLDIGTGAERATLFAEKEDKGRNAYQKYVMEGDGVITIGRAWENGIAYGNCYVSGRHASIAYDGERWRIQDRESANGIYVNRFRVKEQSLEAGDLVYIMGLKIVVGHRFLAINNPDGLVRVTAGELRQYCPQQIERLEENKTETAYENDFFFRPPRFYKEIQKEVINIDPPPQPEKKDTVPMVLMLGPSVTMAAAATSTALMSALNVLNGDGGEMIQALPALVMAGSMVLGTVLWPTLAKQYEKKEWIRNERKRRQKYLAYLDEIQDEVRRKCKRQSEILHSSMIAPEECVRRIVERSDKLWERAAGQSDFLRLRVGIGESLLQADVHYQEKKFTLEDDDLQNAMLALGERPKLLQGVPIGISLKEEGITGIVGAYEAGMNMMKLMILQMIALHSYDELKLVLITDAYEDQRWEFVKWIPHFWSDDKSIRFLATDADEVKRLSAFFEKELLVRLDRDKQDITILPHYVVLSTSKALQDRCEVFQRMLDRKADCEYSMLLYGEKLQDLPKETRAVIMLNGKESKIFDGNDASERYSRFTPDLLNEALMAGVTEEISNIMLDMGSKGAPLPNTVTFLEMFQVGNVKHLNALSRWRENNPTVSLQTPVGVIGSGELLWLDLHEKYHGPHGLIAGMTGSGKSEFIITYILSLAVNYHPDEVAFILIDYKGGGLTGAFEDEERGIKLPHLAGTITNLDGSAIKRALTSIQSELRRRQAAFQEARKISNEGTMDIYSYQQMHRDGIVREPIPHLFIISDEFAELKSQQPEFMDQLISTARIGRSLGVHLILATQKPNGVVDDQIWSNSKFRICLKVQEKVDSQDMIKCSDAAELSQTGRFYLQVGFNELFVLGQSAWCGAPYRPGETIRKAEDSGIQVVDHTGRLLLSLKSEKKEGEAEGRGHKQIVEIIRYLSELAKEEGISARPLWLPPIPSNLYIDELEEKYGMETQAYQLEPLIGEYDDPFNQRQEALRIPISQEGNCLIYGSAGSGKSMLLAAICYSLIKNHDAEEIWIYLLDFGSETLKAFEEAPQVGDVILGIDEEKTINLLKMLDEELGRRKELFARYGGDYQSYRCHGGDGIPNIVVLMNDYSYFAEQYEDYHEAFMALTRDGVKYGIYFIVALSSTNEMRYKTVQNFKQALTLQLNDTSDYSVIVGRTDGLEPCRFKGRGLIRLGRVYEFQTAYCRRAENQIDFLRAFSETLKAKAESFAPRVPVLPHVVNAQSLDDGRISLERLPIGISKKTLDVRAVNLSDRVIYPVVARELMRMAPFAEELVQVLKRIGAALVVVDSGKVLSERADSGCRWICSHFEDYVRELFREMVNRNNEYKDSGMDMAVLEKYQRNIIVIVGVRRLYEQLSEDGKDKMNVLLEFAQAVYKIHFVMMDAAHQFGSFSYENWYRVHISGSEGLWVGDGVADQSVLKLNRFTPDLYEEMGYDYGYMIKCNRPILMKVLSSGEEEE